MRTLKTVLLGATCCIIRYYLLKSSDMSEIQHKNAALVESMFKAGSHFAYTRARRHPTAAPFIFGLKNRVEIFDLEKTSEKLIEAKEFISSCAFSGKKVLFVGTKNEAREAVQRVASAIEMPYVN